MTHGPLPHPTTVERPFYESGRDGTLRFQRCLACLNFTFPPARRCPQCGAFELEWQALSGRGTIWSWTIIRKTYFATMPAPYSVIRVCLDEGRYLMTNLVGDNSLEPRIGDRVAVVFQQEGNLFLPQFRKIA